MTQRLSYVDRGNEEIITPIIIRGIQPGRVRAAGKARTGAEPTPRTADELRAAIDAAAGEVARLEEKAAANKVALATARRTWARNEERALRRERNEVGEQLRAWQQHAGLLGIELKD